MTASCELCGKQCADQNGLYNHMKAKHPKEKRAHLRPRIEREPSLGEELAEALADYAAGIEPPEHLMLMFRDQFNEVRRDR